MSIVVFIFIGCSKSDKYKSPVDNDELKATISIDGAAPFSFLSKADAVAFISSVSGNGEKLIDIATANNNNINLHISISLRNFNPPGIYNFGFNAGVTEPATCIYFEGNSAIGISYIYSTVFQQASGFIQIDSFSSTYVSGTFNAKCIQPPNDKVLQITSGSFKGHF